MDKKQRKKKVKRCPDDANNKEINIQPATKTTVAKTKIRKIVKKRKSNDLEVCPNDVNNRKVKMENSPRRTVVKKKIVKKRKSDNLKPAGDVDNIEVEVEDIPETTVVKKRKSNDLELCLNDVNNGKDKMEKTPKTTVVKKRKFNDLETCLDDVNIKKVEVENATKTIVDSGADVDFNNKPTSNITKTFTNNVNNKVFEMENGTEPTIHNSEDKNIDEIFEIMEKENSLSRIIILKHENDTHFTSLQNSCKLANILMNITKYGNGFALEIDGEVLAKGNYPKLYLVRNILSKTVYDQLSEICFVIEKKPFNENCVIDATIPTYTEPAEANEPKEVDEPEQPILDEHKTNPGYKLLLKMGWSGKGLGSNEQGIVNAIKVKKIEPRQKITEKNYGQYIVKMAPKIFENYLNSNEQRMLRFDKCLTNEQRSVLHRIAKTYGLITKSLTIEHNRRFIVDRKVKESRRELVERLLKCGGEDMLHILSIPKKFAHLFKKI